MDWVETTGKTVDEATQRALQHLGVGLADADVEILEEPKTGLFGRTRGEARVRARVRPSGPRPKRTRRSSPKSEGRSDGNRRSSSNESRPSDAPRPPREPREPKSETVQGQGTSRSAQRRRNRSGQATNPQSKDSRPPKEETMAEGISLAEQADIAKEFLIGLLEKMNLTAEVSVKEIDAETVELSVNANPPTELGVLVGPRGTTLQALQEITRTVVQAKSPSRTDRILVDVAQYRERRVAALGRFANQVAEEVRETGEERALEPMSAADRKAVHDALTEADGIVTRSEGEDPRRFVVIAPA